MVGGPPCTDFSSARRAPTTNAIGARGNLSLVYTKLVCEARPRYFVFENVPSIKTIGRAIYSKVVNRFRRAGYGLTEIVMNASHYGAATMRQRLFIVGVLGGEDGALERCITARQKFGNTIRCQLEKDGLLSKNDKHRAVYYMPPNNDARGIYLLN